MRAVLKYRFFLRKQKRIFKYLAIKYRYALLFVLTGVFFLSVFMLRTEHVDEPGIAATDSRQNNAIRKIDIDEKVCALTFDIAGNESEKDIRLTSEVINGLKAPALFFASGDFICEHEEMIKELTEKNIEIGLLLNNSFENKSREDTMLTAATENEKYYSVMNKYPKFVKVSSDKKGIISEVLRSFRQYEISYSFLPGSLPDASVSSGDICSFGSIGTKTPYIAARFISAMINEDMKPAALTDMVYDIESEVDPEGVQKNSRR